MSRYRDLQYPDTDERYCTKHPNFPKSSYGNICAYCRQDLPTLIHEGFQIEIPNRIRWVGLYFQNIANAMILIGIIYAIIASGFNPNVFVFIIVVFYILFRFLKRISIGIYKLRRGSYYFLPIIPSILGIVLMFRTMISGIDGITIVWLVALGFFSLPFFLIFSDGLSRVFFDLSKSNLHKLEGKIDLVPMLSETKEKIKRRFKENIMVMGLISLGLWYYLVTFSSSF